MAALNIVSSEVFPSANAVIDYGRRSAENIVAGKIVAVGFTGKWEIPSGTVGRGISDIRGIALNHAYANQPLSVAIIDPAFTFGATANMTVSESYALDSSGGNVVPYSDLSSGTQPVTIGLAVSASVLNLDIVASGQPKP